MQLQCKLAGSALRFHVLSFDFYGQRGWNLRDAQTNFSTISRKYIMQRKMYKWVKIFRICVMDEGCPTTSRTADSVERVNALVREDRRITATDIHY